MLPDHQAGSLSAGRETSRKVIAFELSPLLRPSPTPTPKPTKLLPGRNWTKECDVPKARLRTAILRELVEVAGPGDGGGSKERGGERKPAALTYITHLRHRDRTFGQQRRTPAECRRITAIPSSDFRTVTFITATSGFLFGISTERNAPFSFAVK